MAHLNKVSMAANRRTVFFISDQTAITSEVLGQSLLTQFDGIDFRRTILPFVNETDKAVAAREQINRCFQEEGERPIIFCTFTNPEIRRIVETSDSVCFDFFDTFISPLEQELGTSSSHAMGRTHGMVDPNSYHSRIDTVNFALFNDDGANLKQYPRADVILIGVSRSGKTPTCLYLALQFGINAANYPLTEDDLGSPSLPRALKPFQDKLFGLTISPDYLQRIREERRPASRYASLQQCRREIDMLEELYFREKIPYLNTTAVSIEEIATTILQQTGLHRHLF
jgi:regulator of PEP synthase PpsR (kinase-PPPase family)